MSFADSSNINAQSLRQVQTEAQHKALLFEHRPNAYGFDIVDCAAAAVARNVPLDHELKHLLLKTDLGYCLAHVTGDRELSLRKVKRHLGVRQACLAELDEFPSCRLERGTVCPFIQPLWTLRHLIDKSIPQRLAMTTNDGTTRGYVKFDPRVLFLAPDHAVGDFAV